MRFLVKYLIAYSQLYYYRFKKSSGTTSFVKMYPTKSFSSPYHSKWMKPHYCKRLHHFIATPLRRNDVVFIGDSITEQGIHWDKKFGIRKVRNRGISGDMTDGVLHRLNEIAYYKPKAVFILIGINDLNNYYETHQGNKKKYKKAVPSVGYIPRTILKITQKIKESTPETDVYVRTVLPTDRPVLVDHIIKINSKIKKNATEGGYTVIDLYSAFAAPNNLIIDAYTRDGLHLSSEGYKHWVAFEKDIVRQYRQ
ncbi:GDSL-type esterase/lipase family protein [Neptunitalea lumnitzerae]|uniref:Sialate O-acetylesterase n=1 Tax=Neptunitalea lumnitzerae TaxID=2965509 RepID=A0ABQ5MII9_9FLAO|nr:GDSL-type esterase/lipase family protein [Neptunitalea sp. Y10]GLB49209.1 sialate O-acetylesterase [Neptunitalea sp. Y10]